MIEKVTSNILATCLPDCTPAVTPLVYANYLSKVSTNSVSNKKNSLFYFQFALFFEN